MVHELKTWPVWFEMVRSGRKTFELRVNDRNYQCGDTLLLREWDPKTEVYTGSEERRVVADIIDMSPLSECVAMVFMDDASDALRARVAELEAAIEKLLPGIACVVWYADEEGLTDQIMTEITTQVGVLRGMQRVLAARKRGAK